MCSLRNFPLRGKSRHLFIPDRPTIIKPAPSLLALHEIINLYAISLPVDSFLSYNTEKLSDLAKEKGLDFTVESPGRAEGHAKFVEIVKHQESSPFRGYHSDDALCTTRAPGDKWIACGGLRNLL